MEGSWRETMVAASETFRSFELYAAAAAIYYVLAILTARITTLMERSLALLPAAERKH